MTTVKEILDTKGHEVWSIGPDTTVYETITMMAEKEVGALLVTENGKPVGLVSERDYARKVILKGRSSQQTMTRDIMTKRVIYAYPDQTIEECMAIMTEQRIRHIPVIDGDTLLGMVSIGDLVKSIIAEQQFLIKQL